jgi:hypothetical protein
MPAPSMGPSVTQYTSPSPTQYHNQFPNQQYHTGTQSQPISPVHSTPNTPQNASPTSPRSTMPMLHQHQQLRPLKSPMYVPAVLRPTDPPKRQTKSSPPTPPKSVNSSFDSLQDRFARPLSRTSTLATIATRDSAKGGLGVGRDILGEIGLDPKEFPEVKDGPTRGHWKVCYKSPFILHRHLARIYVLEIPLQRFGGVWHFGTSTFHMFTARRCREKVLDMASVMITQWSMHEL